MINCFVPMRSQKVAFVARALHTSFTDAVAQLASLHVPASCTADACGPTAPVDSAALPAAGGGGVLFEGALPRRREAAASARAQALQHRVPSAWAAAEAQGATKLQGRICRHSKAHGACRCIPRRSCCRRIGRSTAGRSTQSGWCCRPPSACGLRRGRQLCKRGRDSPVASPQRGGAMRRRVPCSGGTHSGSRCGCGRAACTPQSLIWGRDSIFGCEKCLRGSVCDQIACEGSLQDACVRPGWRRQRARAAGLGPQLLVLRQKLPSRLPLLGRLWGPYG